MVNHDSFSQLSFSNRWHHRFFTYLKAGLRIATTPLQIEKPLAGTEEEIIKQIHTIRYSENNPYVITGGHFYQIFVRNLGVFFNALLDPRIPSTDDDWSLRQRIALKTLIHDLEIFKQAGKDFVTLTPVKKNVYTGLNIYARASDSLHAVVYTLNALLDEQFITNIFPGDKKTNHKLQTQDTAKKLLERYKPSLIKLIKNYHDDLLDSKTGLVKKNLLLASARDGIQRSCSFYDNVMLWATIRLSAKLDLYTISNQALLVWKQRIIKTFWNSKEGMFLDDLSENGHLFSADSFIVLSTQFFDLKNKDDRHMLKQMVQYVKKNQLDQPFPLHYSTVDLPKQLYGPVRYFAPSYMGTSIWCHWGMEYIKCLLYLAKDDPEFLNDAQKHLSTYKKNIEHYGGYPETYDKHGKILKTRLYRSVLHNGWVINYEQTKMISHST